MDVAVYQFKLALRYPFTISRHTYRSIKTMILELSLGRAIGYGEATTNPYYQMTEDVLLESFSEASEILKDYDFKDPEILWDDLNPVFSLKQPILLIPITILSSFYQRY